MDDQASQRKSPPILVLDPAPEFQNTSAFEEKEYMTNLNDESKTDATPTSTTLGIMESPDTLDANKQPLEGELQKMAAITLDAEEHAKNAFLALKSDRPAEITACNTCKDCSACGGTHSVTQPANAIAKTTKEVWQAYPTHGFRPTSPKTNIFWLNAGDILKLLDDLPAEKPLRYETSGKIGMTVQLQQKRHGYWYDGEEVAAPLLDKYNNKRGGFKFEFPERKNANAFIAYLVSRGITKRVPPVIKPYVYSTDSMSSW